MIKILSAVTICAFALMLILGANTPADPREAARLNNLGVAYMNQQLFDKALKAFQDAAAKDPALKIATLNQGVALLNLQRLDDAKKLLEQSAKDNPTDPHAWYNLGLYYRNSDAAPAAVDAFKRVTGIDPNDADTWYFLGATYAQQRRYPEAISAFEKALKLDPLHASAQFGLARAYQQSGQSDPARDAMKKFQYITQNKLGSPISLAYGEQGKYSRAEDSPMAPEKVPPQIPVKFVDVTKEAGITSRLGAQTAGSPVKYFGPGACFLDYDNDGNIDLFLPDNGTQGGMSLYHNLGNGKFEDVTKKAGLDRFPEAISCTAGDYDNDGFSDLAVSLGDRVLLLHNEKNGTFKDVAGTARLKQSDPSVGVNFVDYDHDGDLDLYVTRTLRGALAAAAGEQIRFPSGLEFPGNVMWRNDGNGTFTDVTTTTQLYADPSVSSVGSDVNNDRAVDLVVTDLKGPSVFLNPREGKFHSPDMGLSQCSRMSMGIAVLDFNHDGWMDLAFTHEASPGISLWRNDEGKAYERVPLPELNWSRAFGVVAFDYDNDGWVDLAAVGETQDGRGEVRLFRNLGPDGWKDVSADVGLDKIQLKSPRTIIAGDYDNDGAVDLLITQNHGPAVLLRNEGGNKNNWLRLGIRGLADNKSGIGTKVEIFSDGIRQKYEIYGSSGYLGQNSPYLTIGLGQSKQADVVRMLWPTGVLQDEVEVPANKFVTMNEIDRRGSSCPTLFAWDGTRYALVADMLGAGVVGHWVGPPSASGKAVPDSDASLGERNIPRPVEYVKLDRSTLRQKDGKLSFRFMEPLEESVYLDKVELLAVDHPAGVDVYPNEYFASNPPYPPFKLVFSQDARPPAAAHDEHGHDVLPDLLAHRYFGDFKVLSFAGFTEPHTLELDLGEPYRGGPLWLLMHGEIEYFTATSMYAADQAHITPFAPYLEALQEETDQVQREKHRFENSRFVSGHRFSDAESHSDSNAPSGAARSSGTWHRVIDDIGFPAGGARTMTADLTGKLPIGTRRIRFTTNLQIYWDSILISRTPQNQQSRLTQLPLSRADLRFHGFPLKIEDQPPGNVKYIYEQASATGPYTRPAGAYTRYGDVLPLLTSVDDKFAVFGSGDEVALDFDPSKLPQLPQGWVRDYFFAAHGYEKDMDFYAYHGDSVDPLPYRDMGTYPYPGRAFPSGPDHLNYLLEFNTRFMSGKEVVGYSFRYEK